MQSSTDLLYRSVAVVEYSSDCSELSVATAAALRDQLHHGTSTVEELGEEVCKASYATALLGLG